METAVDITLYRSCEDLPLYNFHKILETGNYAFLIREFDEYKSPPKYEEEKLKTLFEDIYEEYLHLTEDNKTLMYFAVFSELIHLETRFLVASSMLQHIVDCRDNLDILKSCAEVLRKWKYKFDLKIPVADAIYQTKRQLKASQNKIELKRHELEQYKDSEGEQITLAEQLVAMEQALERNMIDPKITTVQKWVAMSKQLERINEQRRKQFNR